jgi:hypothetical protein
VEATSPDRVSGEELPQLCGYAEGLVVVVGSGVSDTVERDPFRIGKYPAETIEGGGQVSVALRPSDEKGLATERGEAL